MPYLGPRNSCVARGRVTAAGDAVVYTVPAGFVFLLKNVLIWPLVTGAFGVQINVNGSNAAGGAPVTVINQTEATPINYSTWVALNSTDTLHFNGSAQPYNYWVSGAVLPDNPALSAT